MESSKELPDKLQETYFSNISFNKDTQKEPTPRESFLGGVPNELQQNAVNNTEATPHSLQQNSVTLETKEGAQAVNLVARQALGKTEKKESKAVAFFNRFLPGFKYVHTRIQENQASPLAKQTAKDLHISSRRGKKAIDALMDTPKTEAELKAKLEELEPNLRKAGIEGRLIIKKSKTGENKVRVTLVSSHLLGKGSFKACLTAIRLGGKRKAESAQPYKKIVTYKETFHKSDKEIDKKAKKEEFDEDVATSIKFSEILQPLNRELFMKYKMESYTTPGSNEVKTSLKAVRADKGTLKGNITKLTPEQRVSYTQSLAEAVRIMAANGIRHRDLKPDNILIVDGKPVIADFGLMVQDSDNIEGTAGTRAYKPPKNFNEQPGDYAKRQDAYALGVILLQIATKGEFHSNLLLNDDDQFDPNRLKGYRDELYNQQTNPLAQVIYSLLDPYQQSITMEQVTEKLNGLNADNSQVVFTRRTNRDDIISEWGII